MFSLFRKPTNKEKLDMIKRHFELLREDKGEKLALLEIRSQALYYLKGLPDAKTYKEKICKTKSRQEFLDVLAEYEKILNN